jgi:hypothetical protein
MFHSSLTEIGNHRLDVEDVLRPLVRPDVQIGVVLERHADQVADRVLRELGQLLGAQFGMGGRGGEQCGGRHRQSVYCCCGTNGHLRLL